MNKRYFIEQLDMLEKKTNVTEDFCKTYHNCTNVIILCGGGHASEYYVEYLTKHGIIISAIMDRMPKDPLNGISVYTFNELQEMYDLKNCIFVISAPSLVREFKHELMKYVGEEQIYYFEVELYEYYGTAYKQYLSFLQNNRERLAHVWEQLEDDYSRETMLKVLEGRLTGDLDVVSDIWTKDQYWPENIINFSEKEVIIECGSSDGQTICELCDKLSNKFRHIYLFEPSALCKPILEKIIMSIGEERITFFQKGTYKESGTLTFHTDKVESGLAKIDDAGSDRIEVVAIDDVITGRVTYIKMDIEGAELDTLRGAEKIILRDKPKLAVCIYHKDEDMLNIMEYLYTLNPEYKFYMRHHNCNMTETVLYAV